MSIFWIKKIDFCPIYIWKFFRTSVAIWQHIRNSTPYRLYANGSSDDPLSNCGSGIAEIILWVEILNFKKIVFWAKIYGNSLDQWLFGNIRVYEIVHHTDYIYANGILEDPLFNHKIILWVEILN